MVISDFAIKRPLITVVAMVSLVIFGMFALMKLKTDEFPDVAPPWLTVGVVYPGASPEIVEKEVLDPVEEQIGSIAGVKRIMTIGSGKPGPISLRLLKELRAHIDASCAVVSA